MEKLSVAIISILGTCLLSTHANSASFDCNKATTWVEKTICTNNELSALDEAMAKKYREDVNHAANNEDSDIYKNNVILDQKLWLTFQRNTCKDTECLIREYTEHIEETTNYGVAQDSPDELSTSDLPNKNAFGEFSKNFQLSIYNVDGKHKNAFQDAKNALSINKVDNKPYLSVIESDLVFTNYHTCSIGDSMAEWSQNHWVINDSNQPDEILELRLYPASYNGKTQLLLRDIGDQFRWGRCGVRGYFDGIILEQE